MYDKLKIYTSIENVEVLDNHKINVLENTTFPEENKLKFYYRNGIEQNGVSAVYKLNEKNRFYYVDFKYNNLFISFNPSVVRLNSNFLTCNNYNLEDVINKSLSHFLDDIGIRCNLDTFKISRIDLCRNRWMKYPIKQYNRTFDFLKMKRAKRENKFTESYTTMNNSRAVCFYDKIKEMKDNKEEMYIPKKDINSNILRCELRLMKNPIIESDLEIKQLSELYKEDVYNNIEDKYLDFLRENVFKNRIDYDSNLVLDLNGEMELMKKLKDKHKYPIMEYLTTFGISSILEKYGSISNFKKFLEECEFDRSTIYRIGLKLEEKARLIKEVRKEVSLNELLGELERELLKKNENRKKKFSIVKNKKVA